jgi:hypothetical protein
MAGLIRIALIGLSMRVSVWYWGRQQIDLMPYGGSNGE